MVKLMNKKQQPQNKITMKPVCKCLINALDVQQSLPMLTVHPTF